MQHIVNAVIPGRMEPGTITIDDGVITAIDGSAPNPEVPADQIHDAGGRLVIPGMVNTHAHIDKTLFSGPWVPAGASRGVHEAIAHERRHRDRYGLPKTEYIAALVDRMVERGTSHIRSHTDVDPGVGLRGIEAVAEVAAANRDRIDIQQVAFPQGGLITNPGTLELLRDSVAAGAQVIGGLDPAGFDDAPEKHLEAIFDLAADTGAGLDIHLHDDGSLGAWEMKRIAAMTQAYELGGKVAISHAFGIAHEPTQAGLLEHFASAGVALTSAVVYNAPIPPLRACAEAGVTLAAGTDGINDLWGPFGDGDMLLKAMLMAYRNSVRGDADLALALDTVTRNGAQVIGIESYGLKVGAAADLVVVDAHSVAQAVAQVPQERLVYKAGRVVAGAV